ncbi:hypothetical protein BDP27DRAFT_1408365 [Rhodocollybia butyracea]|uniref:SWIM-type domain-containing protein n=1 Tax=Rhodocollybia butyracea TaxID=206335 RepID=A0A9P5PA30_9AGAR|nr:hypothetical protein BDP27DRAFT_1408365 [Rhodocollybia butyracea]
MDELRKSAAPLSSTAQIQQREVKIGYLSLAESQRNSVNEIYKSSRQIALSFKLDNTPNQEAALTKLAELGLDQVDELSCESSSCGYHKSIRQQRDEHKKSIQVNTKRRNPYQFTGCLAHVEIVERIQDGAVTSICGVFVHNEACTKSAIQRTPQIPLHEHVYEEALKQLQNGASITAIQEKNRTMINEKLYRDMGTYNPDSTNVRYLFLHSDHATLYRKASKELGVDARIQPQYNVNNWLDPGSPEFNPQIAEATLEVQLIATVEYSVAKDLISHNRSYFTNLVQNTEAKHAAEAALEHIKYLDVNWMSIDLWKSWSEWGRVKAAAAIGITVQGVIPTTNHLESFNGILKRKYIQRYLHSGHRLRFDTLIMLLITKILPQAYMRRTNEREYRLWLTSRFREAAGGADILELQKKARTAKLELCRVQRSLCWWPQDETRDLHATQLLHAGRLRPPTFGLDRDTFITSCLASEGLTEYQLSIHRSGKASCSCLDFYDKGAACKHLRAFRVLVDSWVTRGLETAFHYPLSLVEAQQIAAVTPSPPNISSSVLSPLPPSDVDPCSSMATDWTMVQALGGDRTTLGGAAEEDNSGASGTGSVSGSSEGENPVRNTEAPTSLFSSQLAAIQTQIGSRLQQQAVALLPNLYALESLLEDVTILSSPSRELVDLHDVIDNLSARLSQIRARNSPSPSVPPSLTGSPKQGPSRNFRRTVSDSTVFAPQPTRSLKRQRQKSDVPTLRAPSPERKQIRKASHGTL